MSDSCSDPMDMFKSLAKSITDVARMIIVGIYKRDKKSVALLYVFCNLLISYIFLCVSKYIYPFKQHKVD